MYDIGVFIISHGKTDYLRESVESVFNQTLLPKEFIIISDEDLKYENSYNVGDIGWAKKANIAVSKLSTEFVLLLCDDDKLDPKFLNNCSQYLKGFDIVYTDMVYFQDIELYVPSLEWNIENMQKNPVPQVTSLVKRSLWNKVGGFDENIIGYPDWDFWWKCIEVGASAYRVPEGLFYYRRHGKQDSTNCNHALCREKILNKHMETNNESNNLGT